MKKLIAFAGVILMTGAAHGGCGTKIPVEGKFTKYDAEKKIITVGREDITLAASAEIKDATGASVKIEDLIDKEVVVSTDKHTSKAESITVMEGDAPKEAKEKPVMKSNVLAESQDWTNSTGTTITAAVQKVEGGKVYFLKDGTVIPYDVQKLSPETIDKLKSIIAASKE